MRLLKNVSIQRKLFIYSVGVILLITALSYAFLYKFVVQNIEHQIKEELTLTNQTITDMVETVATVSIKNHLRNIAEKKLETTRYLYQRFLSGEITEAEARKKATIAILGETVGDTGYLYCINSSGVAVVHPNKGVVGRDFMDREFIKVQIRNKEGYLEYDWKNPGELSERPKALYMSYFEPWDWIISATSYKSEFKGLVHVDDFRDRILAMTFGKTGYSFILDSLGNIVIHPELSGNMLGIRDARGFPIAEAMIHEKRGWITYWWKNPSEKAYREKFVAFGHIPDMDWIVASSAYTQEVFSPFYEMRKSFFVIFILVLVVTGGTTLFISTSITKPMQMFIRQLEKETDENWSYRFSYEGNDEIGRLSKSFNEFMERLGAYRKEHLEELNARKQIERNLRESETQIRSLVAQSPISILMIDTRGKLILANKAWEELWGVAWEEISLVEYNIFEDEQVKALGMASKLLNAIAGESTFLSAHEFDLSPTVKQGKKRWVETTIYPVKDESGSVQNIVLIQNDISEQKELENQLSNFAAAIEQADEEVVMTALDGTIQYVNPSFEKNTGYSKGETIGQKPSILKSNIHNSGFYEDLWTTILSKKIWKGIIHNRCKDGRIAINDMAITPILDSEKTITGFVSIRRDITEKVKRENRIMQSQKMEAMGTLAGGIAHDFNNILSGIFGYSSLVEKHSNNPEKIKRHSGQILKGAQRAADLVQQILTFSRQTENKKSPVELHQIVKEAVKFLKSSIPANIEIEERILSQATVMADSTQIYQIIINLCTNAHHAMKSTGGRLGVTLEKVEFTENKSIQDLGIAPGQYLRLEVSDTGSGMDSKTLNRLYEPYYTTKKSGEGTGLGLAVVFGIVEKHKGYIKAYSELDKGSVFHVYLPLLQQNSQPINLEETKPIKGGTDRILLVDDEEGIRKSTREYLEDYGYKITEATNGEEAITDFRNNPYHFDLVITDVSMPKMDGDELVKQILNIRKDIPIIVSSGFSYAFSKDILIQSSNLEIIQKPFESHILLKLIRKLLDDDSSHDSNA